MTNEVIKVQDPDPALSEKTNAGLTAAKNLTVCDTVSYEYAAIATAQAKALIKEAEDERTKIKAPILESGRRVDALFAKIEAPAKEAVAVLDVKMAQYRNEQVRIAAIAQAKLDEEARKRREELERQAREAQRKAQEKADAERKAADEAEAAGRAAEADRIRQGSEARKRLADQKVADRLDQAAQVVAPQVQAEVPRVSGLSVIKTYTYEVIDESVIPRQFMRPDEDKIKKIVQALHKDAEGTIPGIRVIEGERQASRSARAA